MRKFLPVVMILVAAVYMFSCSDTKTESEYYKIAYDQYNSGKYEESIKNFKILLETYPKGENAPNTTFMIGFIYANHLQNFEEAKKYYNLFMEKYPKHELVSSAKYELETMGQDINDLDIFKNIEEEVNKEEVVNKEK